MTEENKSSAPGKGDGDKTALRAFLEATAQVCANRVAELIDVSADYAKAIEPDFKPGDTRFVLIIGTDESHVVLTSAYEVEESMRMVADVALAYAIKRMAEKHRARAAAGEDDTKGTPTEAKAG